MTRCWRKTSVARMVPTHTPRPLFPLAALLVLLAGRGEPEPPNLSGTYSLESVQSAEWTGGSTLTPPAATGVLLLDQARYDVGLGYGHAKLELTHSSGPLRRWSGSYSAAGSGVFTMRLDDVRFEGEYMLEGSTLTTVLSGQYSESGPSPVGTLVWKLEPEDEG